MNTTTKIGPVNRCIGDRFSRPTKVKATDIKVLKRIWYIYDIMICIIITFWWGKVFKTQAWNEGLRSSIVNSCVLHFRPSERVCSHFFLHLFFRMNIHRPVNSVQFYRSRVTVVPKCSCFGHSEWVCEFLTRLYFKITSMPIIQDELTVHIVLKASLSSTNSTFSQPESAIVPVISMT